MKKVSCFVALSTSLRLLPVFFLSIELSRAFASLSSPERTSTSSEEPPGICLISGWWTIAFELGVMSLREPLESTTAAIEYARPTHAVVTGAPHPDTASQITRPASTEPPGESIASTIGRADSAARCEIFLTTPLATSGVISSSSQTILLLISMASSGTACA